jgi:hypothetical protein
MTLQRRFAGAVDALVSSDERVEWGRMLRAPALRTRGGHFAFASGDDLVVKLPAGRVTALIASGDGRPCEIRPGSPMREWVRVSPTHDRGLAAYLRESRDFVLGRG